MSILRFRIALAIVLAVLPGLLFINSCTEKTPPAEPRAAIIDQLYNRQPNPAYIDEATRLLESCGLKVDVISGDAVTVDYLRTIASPGYRVIIFRAHAGLLGSEGKTIQKTCIFTNELYTETQHAGDQLTNKLAKARVDANFPWVFAIGADFVKQSIKGRFNQTMIIMEGCSTLHIDDLAKAFIEKGASVYSGWNLSVGLDYVDEATEFMLRKMIEEESTVDLAVMETLNAKGRDPDFGAVLRYYPPDQGQLKLVELVWR